MSVRYELADVKLRKLEWNGAWCYAGKWYRFDTNHLIPALVSQHNLCTVQYSSSVMHSTPQYSWSSVFILTRASTTALDFLRS